ncbi:hypothetical protein PHJA_000847200, partial [Phtheirospermum japonicum]
QDCVDFLFYILSLPVAKLVSLLVKDRTVGSLANLYESVENLNESYIQPNRTRDNLLKHVSSVTTGSPCVPLLAIEDAPKATEKKLYRCRCVRVHHSYYNDTSRAVCPNCGKCMDKLLEYVEYPPAAAIVDDQQKVSMISEGGFVKGGGDLHGDG